MLAVPHLEDGDTASNVLAAFLGVLDGLNFGVKPSILTVNSTTVSVPYCFSSHVRDTDRSVGTND